MDQLDYSLADSVRSVIADSRSRIFVFDNWFSPHFFWKEFLSGVFIVIVMTGLDQDMMQKNLTCRTLREAQKDMCSYGFAFVPANLLFMSLGVLLAQLYENLGISLPAKGDDLLTSFVSGSLFNCSDGIVPILFQLLPIVFALGIVAASFSSADSALTSLTTSYCVDICRRSDDERLRKNVHLAMCGLFVLFILVFDVVNSRSLIDAIYIIVSYTYGPLLGLFAFGLFTRRIVADCYVPFVCLLSPFICYAIDVTSKMLLDYSFGYELLMINGGITFLGLWLSSRWAERQTAS